MRRILLDKHFSMLYNYICKLKSFLEVRDIFCKNLFSVISLALFVFIGNTAFAACPEADVTGNCFVDMGDFALMGGQWLNGYDCNDLTEMASEWLTEGIIGMVWVDINDPGVSGHEPFNGEMSKYETTNAQYCEYLSAALASGDITVTDGVVYGADGSNSGEDFVGETYFYTYGVDSYSQIDCNDVSGSFSVRSRDGYDMSNHPVVEVSWYGATAFCNYYGYRLPTEWEWQAVADYGRSYIYGCGKTINQSKANYVDNVPANPLNLSSYPYTSPAGHYSSYGYGMNDMAGNVSEWTSSCYYSGCDYGSRVLRGGSWSSLGNSCTVSFRDYHYPPYNVHYRIGFRVCR